MEGAGAPSFFLYIFQSYKASDVLLMVVYVYTAFGVVYGF
jgi:hypothetical protein